MQSLGAKQWLLESSSCNDAAVRARAFERHGVITKRPAQSRSGVRDHDGVVVFAIAAKDVRGRLGLQLAPVEPALARRRSAPALPTRRAPRRRRRISDLHGPRIGGRRRDGSLRVVKSGGYWARWGRSVGAVLRRPRRRRRAPSMKVAAMRPSQRALRRLDSRAHRAAQHPGHQAAARERRAPERERRGRAVQRGAGEATRAHSGRA